MATALFGVRVPCKVSEKKKPGKSRVSVFGFGGCNYTRICKAKVAQPLVGRARVLLAAPFSHPHSVPLRYNN